MGRRAHQPDPGQRRRVEAMAAYGVPEADIATVIGIDPKTLRKHYRGELDTGEIKANTKVAESLYRKALGDGSQSVTAAIFWLKTRAQWKETSVQEHSVDLRDLREISTEELTQIVLRDERERAARDARRAARTSRTAVPMLAPVRRD